MLIDWVTASSVELVHQKLVIPSLILAHPSLRYWTLRFHVIEKMRRWDESSDGCRGTKITSYTTNGNYLVPFTHKLIHFIPQEKQEKHEEKENFQCQRVPTAIFFQWSSFLLGLKLTGSLSFKRGWCTTTLEQWANRQRFVVDCNSVDAKTYLRSLFEKLEPVLLFVQNRWGFVAVFGCHN